jgi:glycosyltransferase involved in cell wall biosynthesis
MKIFLPFQPKSIGGTSTFAIKFRDVMKQLGHDVYFELPLTYDLLFLIVQAPFGYLQNAKSKGIRIVQRLDGVYYWTIAKSWFPLYNAKSALIRYFYSDYCIYQSNYCRQACNQFLGPSLKPSSIVINGVDLKLFTPSGKKVNLRKNAEELIVFNASDFRYRHQIDPILAAVDTYRHKCNFNCRLVLAGSFSREVESYPGEILKQNWITFLGPLKNKDLPVYERSSDMFIFSHTNPPCPNNIIEAMACGLPICGLTDGSMTELCIDGVNSLLIPIKESGYWTQKRIDTDKFAENIDKVSKNLKRFSNKSRYLAEQKFDIMNMGKKYESIFSKILDGKFDRS